MTDALHVRTSRWPKLLARAVSWMMVACTLAIIIAWLVGRIASDRFEWSQWLLWIPTPAAIAASVCGLPALLIAVRGRTRRRMLVGLWGILLAAIVVYFAAIEHRLYRTSPLEGEGIRILHWSMSHAKEPFLPQAKAILNEQPDLAVVNDAWRSTEPSFQEWAAAGGSSTQADRFTVLSRFPLIEQRVLVKSDGMLAIVLRIDARRRVGRELTILLVDLPSSPRMPRAEIADRLNRLLAEADAPEPDIVIGDFNMTRGSASLHSVFPTLHHAFNDAGGGYAASYHRSFPLYHIDHVLLSDAMRATSYRLIDPGMGRHRMQVTTVTAR